MSLRARCRSFIAVVGLALAAASSQAFAALPYTGLYIFGDSLSDSGNAAAAGAINPAQTVTNNGYVPSAAYASGTFSNGPVWSTQFATMLGLTLTPSIIGGTNYSIGGATTGTGSTSLLNQVGSTGTANPFPFNSLLSTGNAAAPSSALYVIEGGGNNAKNAVGAILGGANATTTISATAAAYSADVLSMVHTLKTAGAQNIIVWNTPNVGMTPLGTSLNSLNPLASTYGSAIATAMNNSLASALAGESGVTIFDTYAFLTNTVIGVLATPGGYNGLTNALNACGVIGVGNCGASIFYDGIHPTTYAHSLLAQQMYALAVPVPEPAEYALMLLGLAVVAGAARRRVRA